MKSLFKKTQDIFSNKSKINKSHQNKVELNKNNFFPVLNAMKEY